MPRVYVSTVLDAPIDRVWQKIRDFNGLTGWVPAIAASEIDGGEASDRIGIVRTLTLGDGGKIKERLLALDDFTHSVSYSFVESPLPVTGYVSHIRLKPLTMKSGTFVEWSGEYEVTQGDPEDMRKLFADGVYGAGLARLAEILATRA
ncbi:MAG: SRPBCC family protein [Aliidongia sp.]